MRKALVPILTLIALLGVTYQGYGKVFSDGRSASEVLIVDTSGSPATLGGSGGTASLFGSAFPTQGTALGAKNGANMVSVGADGSGNLNINCVVGCAGGAFNNNADNVITSTGNGQSASWLYGWDSIGSNWDRVRVDTGGNLNVAIQSSTQPLNTNANLESVSGVTVATAAVGTQKVGIVGSTGGAFDFAGQNATAPANALLGGCQFNTSPTTVTSGNATPIQCDSAGNLKLTLATALPAGTSLLGKTGIDQTTPGTTNAVSLAQLGSTTIATGNGVVGAGVQRVAIASDNTAFSVNLGTIGGAATAAAQATQQTTLDAILTATTAAIPAGSATIGGVTLPNIEGTKAAGTAATSSALVGGVYNSTPLTLTNGQQSAMQFDANGYLKINVATGGGSGGTSSSFAATFPATGTAIGAKNGANMVFLGADGSNNLNVNCAVGCSGGSFNNNADAVATSSTNGQAASWLFGYNGTTWDRLRVDGSKNLLVGVNAALPAGTALIGKVGLDQTTPGTTNAVSVSQIGSTTVSTGNGVVGAGVQRVAIASDNTAFTIKVGDGTNNAAIKAASTAPVAGDPALVVTESPNSAAVRGAGATGSAVPANAQYAGAVSSGNLVGIIQADASVKIDVSTATTTQLVALTSSQKIYITSWDVIAGGTGNVKLVYGTGTNCGTGTTDLTASYNLTAQAGISKGSGLGPILVVPASNALCVTTSAAVQMSGSVAYTKF